MGTPEQTFSERGDGTAVSSAAAVRPLQELTPCQGQDKAVGKDVGEQGREKDPHLPAVMSCCILSHSPPAFFLNSVILNFRAVSLFLVTKRISFNASDNLYFNPPPRSIYFKYFPKKTTIICLKTCFSEVIL